MAHDPLGLERPHGWSDHPRSVRITYHVGRQPDGSGGTLGDELHCASHAFERIELLRRSGWKSLKATRRVTCHGPNGDFVSAETSG